MEVRVKRNQKRFPAGNRKKLNISLKTALMGLMICLLGAAFAWSFGRGTSEAAPSDYMMEKNPVNGKLIFNVVEVVPEQHQGVLRFYIGGQTWDGTEEVETFLTKKLNEPDNGNWWSSGYEDIFYDATNLTSPSKSTNKIPFSVSPVQSGIGYKLKVENNQIFKLCMLGVGNYDPSKTSYENYQDNQAALASFDHSYEIAYRAVTPKELEEMGEAERNKIDYLHIGASLQLTNMKKLYEKIYPAQGTKTWPAEFSNTDDISFKTAMELYWRSISTTNRLAVSIEADSLYRNVDNPPNLYKFYQMLNYADNPADFQKVFKGGVAADNSYYIDPVSGELYLTGMFGYWKDSHLSNLYWEHIPSIVWVNKDNSLRQSSEGDWYNYITGEKRNILIYHRQIVQNDTDRYFNSSANIDKIKEILNFIEKDLPAVDNPIKVLEIEPCTDFRFEDKPENETSRTKLAFWLGVTANSLDVTCVTPNELNGMTTDLVSEYDMLYVGSQVGKLGTSTMYYVDALNNEPQPYQHIGVYSDSIVTLPLINGLLDKDKTTTTEFEALSKIPLNNPSSGQFLKNTGLYLALGEDADTFGHSRFSGNDITVYMKEQLKEFILSGQPVVASDMVCERGYQLQEDINAPSGKKKYGEDSNLYAAFSETGMDWITEEGGGRYAEPVRDNVYNEDHISETNLPKGALQKARKPELMITDSAAAEGGPVILDINEAGTDEGSIVTALQKSNGPSFSYEVGNLGGSAYKMKIIVDQNGDGIFDERKKNVGAATKAGEDAVQTVEITGASAAGEFTWAGRVASGKSICQFRVVVQEEGENGLRAAWTGYMRPNTEMKEEVKILQILSNGSENKLSEHPDFNRLLEEIPDTAKDYNITPESFTAVTASEFGGQYPDEASLDGFDLIIVGFDYGAYDSDMSKESLALLENYITVKKKPVIFAKDTISYVNMDAYKTPVLKKVAATIGMATAGDHDASEDLKNLGYTRTQISLEEYREYAEYNGTIPEEDRSQRIFLETEGHTPYQAVVGPVLKTELENTLGERNTREIGLGFWNKSSTRREPMRRFKVVGSNEEANLGPSEIYDTFGNSGYDVREKLTVAASVYAQYYFTAGWMTQSDLMRILSNKNTVKLPPYSLIPLPWTGIYPPIEGATGYWFYQKDILLHPDFWTGEDITDSKDVDTSSPLILPGDDTIYYTHHGKYLAKLSDTPEDSVRYYCWQKDGAALVSVAGVHTALYPDRVEWGYNMSQSLRHTLGMDRFGITKAAKDDKENPVRDTGTTRELPKSQRDELTELQGFTNGALLEFACTKDTNGNPVQQHEPYADSLAALGTAPRTDTIEALNKGSIGNYPFVIGSADAEKIPISAGHHAPYYQLDLERSLNKGKTDDITVWYTLAGSDGQKQAEASKYFDITRRDAGNNYYLYSKYNAFYTGYNLPGRQEDETLNADQTAARETEMKLFINTIYAALSSSAASWEDTVIEAVVREDGIVSCIDRAVEKGMNNQYVCYYDEDDDAITLNFKLRSKEGGGFAAVHFGVEKEADGDGLLKIGILAETSYELTLPEGVDATAVPIQKAPGENQEGGSGSPGGTETPGGSETPGSGTADEAGTWHQIRIPLSGEDSPNRDALDGQMLVIGVGDTIPAGTESTDVKLGDDSVHAKIRLVKRGLFNLD